MFVNKHDRPFGSKIQRKRHDGRHDVEKHRQRDCWLGLFDHNRVGWHVLADAVEGRMPENPVAGPRRELDRDNHSRLGPDGSGAVLPRDRNEGRILPV
jgi:hypothetical protein